MPELSDDMYCSQQIMVPPMFPYILRQYAKAAIRSQPTDLLRWSTAYFRCLSLNLPPPVKPRLEYPLPKDYDGITPGWLRALLHQLINNTHVDFKVLWDRWIGACQNHQTLIKILCLGGFTDPMAVPLYRFIGLCVGFLSENLTQTMILFCEVVTEEPEGGSAMIQVETFIDVYIFLAEIDASKEQVLLNRYFTDDLLGLLEKKEEKKAEIKKKIEKIAEKEESIETESVEEEEKIEEDRKDAISCPDLVETIPVDTSSSGESEEAAASKSTIIDDKDRLIEATGKSPSDVDLERETKAKKPVRLTADSDVGVAEGFKVDEEEEKISEEEEVESVVDDAHGPIKQEVSEVGVEVQEARDLSDADVAGQEQPSIPEEPERLSDDSKTKPKTEEVRESRTSASTTVDDQKKEEEIAAVDIEHYLEGHGMMGESMSVADLGITKVVDIVDEYSIAEGEEEGEGEGPEKKFEIEEVFVEAIPGIGPVVPTELVEAVVAYMKKCAAEQHGMVMPRNIRHYSCPPLEVYEN